MASKSSSSLGGINLLVALIPTLISILYFRWDALITITSDLHNLNPLSTHLSPNNTSSPSSSSPSPSISHPSESFLSQMRLRYNTTCPTHTYRTRLFSTDPLIIYIHSFISPAEIAYLKAAALPNYASSEVVLDEDENSGVLTDERKSQSAFLDLDPVTECIIERAASFQGSVDPLQIEALQTVRYGIGDEFRVHVDGDEDMPRVTTFFAYLECEGPPPVEEEGGSGTGDVGSEEGGKERKKGRGVRDMCEGGATQFPELTEPVSREWCDVVQCDEEQREDDIGGTAFKAKTGNAVFWSNVYPNGTWHEKVLHAGMPVRKGSKIGLNIWTRREKYVIEGGGIEGVSEG